jgi:hypothetical protein
MTDWPAAAGSGRAPGTAEPGLIHRPDLVAALNRAARVYAKLGAADRTAAVQRGRELRLL